MKLGSIWGQGGYVAVEVSTRRGNEAHAAVPAADPFLTMKPTPSMKATIKYFVTVIAIVLAQVLFGAITAHYAVEGQRISG